ncbi:hypothetical protein R1sor_013291 [Riccia sorocarpa]|uniref:F-box domain-containing protein n=1 Tax=Riccia sorocarpa TaxID=122646 RepID=A0ABD3H909_9MARC
MDSSPNSEDLDTRNHDVRKISWAEVPPDTLVEVFRWLSVEDRLRTLPQICKAWRKASLDPGCWQFVDLTEWCEDQSGEVKDRMVKLVVERSYGGLQELRVSNLDGDASLQFLAQSGLTSMRTLCIPGSFVTDSGLCELILTLPNLEHLDISKCGGITSKALEVIGQNCKSFSRLDWVMWPMHRAQSLPDDCEGMAIAQNMPKLRHLVISAGQLSNSSCKAIRNNCPLLECLDEVSDYDDDSYSYYDSFEDEDVYDWDDELDDVWEGDDYVVEYDSEDDDDDGIFDL